MINQPKTLETIELENETNAAVLLAAIADNNLDPKYIHIAKNLIAIQRKVKNGISVHRTLINRLSIA